MSAVRAAYVRHGEDAHGRMRSGVDELGGRSVSVRAADSERAAIAAEGKRVKRPLHSTVITRLVAGRIRRSDSAQGRGVEERNCAVVAANGERATVGAERFVEQAATAFARDADRGRTAQECGQQIAARRGRVVEVHALAREQQGSLEVWVGQRLRSEALCVRNDCLSLRLAPLLSATTAAAIETARSVRARTSTAVAAGSPVVAAPSRARKPCGSRPGTRSPADSAPARGRPPTSSAPARRAPR